MNPCPHCGSRDTYERWEETARRTGLGFPLLLAVLFGGCGCVSYLFVSFLLAMSASGVGLGGGGLVVLLVIAAPVVALIAASGRSVEKRRFGACRSCGSRWPL